MNVQLWIVLICVAFAVAFIAKKFRRALRSGGCPGCEKDCKSRTCAGGGECASEKRLRELAPLDRGQRE